MKINAIVEWLIDDEILRVLAGSKETIEVDSNYVSACKGDIVVWVEEVLSVKHNMEVHMAKSKTDIEGDFIIKNISKLVRMLENEELKEIKNV